MILACGSMIFYLFCMLYGLCFAARKCLLACGSMVLAFYLCFVFALYEHKNETQREDENTAAKECIWATA